MRRLTPHEYSVLAALRKYHRSLTSAIGALSELASHGEVSVSIIPNRGLYVDSVHHLKSTLAESLDRYSRAMLD